MPVLPAPAGPTHDLGGTRFTSLATPSRGSTETAVWRVQIDAGQPALPHRLTREETFVVLAGEAAVELGGQRRTARPGDAIVVPADVDFAIEAPSGTVELLCCMPVGGQAVTADGTFTPPWAL
jgi:quercetin dioxygenase-like cupin family protein